MTTAIDTLQAQTQAGKTDADPHSIAAVFAGQRETAIRWRASTAAERIVRIAALRDAVLAHADELRAAAAADFRKPATEVDLTEIFPVVSEANNTIKNLRKWMKPHKSNPCC